MLKTIITAMCVLTADPGAKTDCGVGLYAFPPMEAAICETEAVATRERLVSLITNFYPGSTYVLNVRCVDADRSTLEAEIDGIGRETADEMKRKSPRGL
jgi:hypothetical protein